MTRQGNQWVPACPCGGERRWETPEESFWRLVCLDCRRRYTWPEEEHASKCAPQAATAAPRQEHHIAAYPTTGQAVALLCSRCHLPEPCPCEARRTFKRAAFGDIH